MRKVLITVATSALIATTPASYAQQVTTKDQLIGSWKVLSLKATTGDKVAYPLGEQVAGYVTGNKMMVKSPGVIVRMTGATSVVEFELVKAE